VSQIIPGRIVYGRVLDPQGRNAKDNRPLIVVSPNILADDTVYVVAITKELTESPSDHYVDVPWGPTALTRLRHRSAALCTWLPKVSISEVSIGGMVPQSCLNRIRAKLIELHSLGAIPLNPSV
jgi:mRNA-degrading endonuclease toxin of MazEF toxin-antitoxin module